MNDVPVTSEAAQQVAHTLDECIGLRMNQNFGYEILACILDEPFTCQKRNWETLSSAAAFGLSTISAANMSETLSRRRRRRRRVN
jgi:hypothetical protein